MRPFVSILIPVYRVEKYIERCLRSVMQQTYSAQPVECILIDDCGGDSSMQIANRLIEQYNGPYIFRVITNEKNLGVSCTRNNGMRAASGEYIFFLDSDDHITIDCIDMLAKAIDRHPNADVVLGNILNTRYNRKEADEEYIQKHNPKLHFSGQTALGYFFRGLVPSYACNMLVKASIIHDNELFFVPGMFDGEDGNWTFRLYQQAKEVLFVPHTTMVYENTPDSATNSIVKKLSEHIESSLYKLNYIFNHFPKSQYVDATLSLIHTLNYEFDLCGKDEAKAKIAPALYKELKLLRNKLFWRDVRHLRLTLALFETLLFSPFRLIQKSAWYRHHYHAFSQLVRRVAVFFDPLHFFNRRKGLTPSIKNKQ